MKRMFRRLAAAAMLMAMLLSVIPVAYAATRSAANHATVPSIEQQVRAYAKTIDQANADDSAATALAIHGLTGGGKKLSVGKTHALTAALMNSEIVQQTLTAACTQSVEHMLNLGEEALYLDVSCGWATFGYYFSTFLTPQKNQEEMIFRSTWTKGLSGNAYDQSLVWMAGSIAADMEIKRSAVTADTVTYDVKACFWDRFDFSTSSNDGFKNLISGLGALLFREFDWEATVSFQIQVPNTCTHATDNYHWVLDVESGIIHSDTASGYAENTATKYESEQSNGSVRCYYGLEQTIVLAHDKPWEMELVVTDPKNILFNAIAKSYDPYPTLMLHGRTFFCARQYEQLEVSETSILAYTHCYGTALRPNFSFVQGNPYKLCLENRVYDDGSNMIYLTVYNYVDGVSLQTVALDTYYFTDTRGTSHELREEGNNGLSGMDFKINYFGNGTNDYYGNSYEFFANSFDLRVWENGIDGGSGDYFTEKVVKPTCAARGYTQHTCSLCGYSYNTDYVSALPHTFGKYVSDKNATCTKDGTKTAKCSGCSATDTVADVGSATGHKFEGGFCTVCSEKDPDYASGDFTGDGRVTNEDVTYLLWHTLFPADFPVNGGADLTGDGQVTNEDVTYLLWYTLFPEDYPLHTPKSWR